ncbi:MAG: DNA-directed RNA polymerase subunit beta [Chloroflexi bacterium]|nr:DNA-directed RNA polymerase subunit beta [Chloroflexota bacterium]
MTSLMPRVNRAPMHPVKSYARTHQVLEPSNLVNIQLESFGALKTTGIREVLDEINPVQDVTGNRFELRFGVHSFREPRYSEEECRAREVTYEAPLYVTVELEVKETGEVKEQTLFFGDIPMMTSTGTFVINGAERVVVSQLVRSPGAYFTRVQDPSTGRNVSFSKLIPYRGAWLEFETSPRDIISVKIDRKRKLPVTTFLRAIGFAEDANLLEMFADVDDDPEHPYIRTTLERDTAVQNEAQALMEVYRRLRPGEPPSAESARTLLDNLFFNPRRYDLGRVGRYKMNRRTGKDVPQESRTLTKDDIIEMIKMMIRINNGVANPDDIDHLGNRRVRAVGELIMNQLRVGLLRMERVVKERMTILDQGEATPSALINIRPVVAAVREFFGGSQLSQFMDQTNPLAELTHKRRLSALGPGGLSRERAGFDVRDVHYSHYGRICPIETPEGPNIGLLGSLATYARLNDYGFIETPYRRVLKDISSKDPDVQGRTVTETVTGDDGKAIVRTNHVVSANAAKKLVALDERMIAVQPYVSADPDQIVYLPADEEDKFVVAQANSPMDEKFQLLGDRVECRVSEDYLMEPPERVDYMDVAPIQIVSVSTALIPFLEHDDANRALMGSNMQRQAVPLIKPDAPLVCTGMEQRIARDSGQMVLAKASGVVTSVTGDVVVITDEDKKEHTHVLRKFIRSNQGTCLTQRAIVSVGDAVAEGNPLADSSSTQEGDLALGQNVLCAFMAMEGYNFEDAIIVSENLVRDSKFTSIHIERYEVESRDTKLGPGEITRDIPSVGEDALHNLDEEGIIRIGAEVGPGDILVGKVTPKGETELTAEEKLLRAIFGEKARDVKDTSLRVPHGERGKVIDVKVMSRENGDDLSPGVNKLVRVWVAQTRTLSEGDKMAGRHGNKGVVSRIMPVEDMPYLPDGTPVDIILNPIGVPSRMNLGQVLETHLGLAAHKLRFRAATPVFDGATDGDIRNALARAWLLERAGALGSDLETSDGYEPDWAKGRSWVAERGYDADRAFSDTERDANYAAEIGLRLWLDDLTETYREATGEQLDLGDESFDSLYSEALRVGRVLNSAAPVLGKSVLYDGRTGEPFDNPVTVGYIYMLKLIHLVEDKIHARSTGPYSLITQQPLGGKAQFGGQRFGEMEVWALEAYSAAYNLQEMLTVKSDDVVGRVKTYEAIVKGEEVVQPGVPESFNVLLKELQSLGLAVELRYEEDQGVVSSRFTYTGEEEEEEELEAIAPIAMEPVAPAWEADFAPLEEPDGDVGTNVRIDLGAYARKASEEESESNGD